jgi:hypothetical protein
MVQAYRSDVEASIKEYRSDRNIGILVVVCSFLTLASIGVCYWALSTLGANQPIPNGLGIFWYILWVVVGLLVVKLLILTWKNIGAILSDQKNIYMLEESLEKDELL